MDEGEAESDSMASRMRASGIERFTFVSCGDGHGGKVGQRWVSDSRDSGERMWKVKGGGDGPCATLST